MWKALLISVSIALLSIGSTSDVYAQTPASKVREPWSFGANGYYGALFRYRANLPPLSFTHPVALEVYANRHTLGKRQWERQYKHPQLGLAFSYYNYGVPDELGEAFALTAYMDNTLLRFKNSSLRFNLGTGLVYSTRYYHTETNEMNKAIGSPIAFVLRGTVRYEFPLSEQLFMNMNLAFRHFSNGGFNKPNNGMNFPMVGVGLRFQPWEVNPIKSPDTAATAIDKRIHLNLRLSRGVKEVLRDDTKHPFYSASLYASKRLTQTNSLLIGMDVMFDTSIREEYINKNLPVPEGQLDSRLVGITLGHELHIGKLSFVFQMGRYLHQPHGLFPNYYQRWGLKYPLMKHVSASAMLMAHSKTANVVEWGLGFHL